ncbi:ATP synthase subunit I [Proteiniclasticum sp. C24MP]|uniref:N-ATPase subunit AtpR n=1 Tax=Proteiniclasticum sp. C24MP TaxID=3374101 RepID=UPI00375462C6
MKMILAFIVGALLGAVFFGGLYLTVRKLNSIKHPALFMMLSLILRLVILAGGIYLIMDGEIKNLLSAMAGILIVRFVMIQRLGKSVPSERGEGV